MIRVGSNPMMGAIKKGKAEVQTGECGVEMEAGAGVIDYKSRDANYSWQPLEAGRGRAGFSLRAFGGSMVLFTPRFQISGFLNCEKNFCHCKSPSLQ